MAGPEIRRRSPQEDPKDENPPSNEKRATPVRQESVSLRQGTKTTTTLPDTKGKTKEDTPSSDATRPPLPQRTSTAHSQYVSMLLEQDEIPRLHNILAAFFVWLLLAGFLVFPGTFSSFTESVADSNDLDEDATDAILDTVRNVPLVYVGAVACGISAAGMLWLVWAHRTNYVWLLNRLFLPSTGNSIAGLISSLISVYSSNDGQWSIMAKVTACVEGGCLVVVGGLFIITEVILLRRVRTRHGRHYGNAEEEGDDGEGFVHKVERKAKEPGLQPGSVV